MRARIRDNSVRTRLRYAHVGRADRPSRPGCPAVLVDAPVILRGVITGLLARPTSKTSIGKVFQDRAARFGDRRVPPLRRRSSSPIAKPTRPPTAMPRCWPTRGVGRGDVVGVMLRNSPNAVLMMLAVVKCGAVAGMLNYHQRGDVLAHSIGLLDAKVLVAETDLVDAVKESGAEPGRADDDRGDRRTAGRPPRPPTTRRRRRRVQAKDTAFYIFTSGTTGHPKASVMTHHRWLRALAAFGGLGLAAQERRHPCTAACRSTTTTR